LALDLAPLHVQLVRDVLRACLPEGGRAFAFGSRVRGTARRFSDLDLLVQAAAPLPLDVLGRLREAFSESDLPMKVDVIDGADVTPAFRAAIETELIPL
jgi:predicted nucleotidyltransferase